MALHKIKDFDPQYRDHFDGDDVTGLDLYSDNEKIGSIKDVLVDDDGQFRYLVAHTGAWVVGKNVLLPIGRARIDYKARRVYAKDLTKAQVEALPEFTQDMPVDQTHEEQVRNVYRPAAMGTAVAQDAELYGLNDQDHSTLRLYQERLIASKTRQKTGEVAIGKHVETETRQISVPIEKERVVIERTPGNSATVAPSDANFREGEVARMELYEETPDIRKEAFVREEVNVRKEVERTTVNAEETVRREELDVNTEGRPLVDNKSNQKFKSRPSDRAK